MLENILFIYKRINIDVYIYTHMILKKKNLHIRAFAFSTIRANCPATSFCNNLQRSYNDRCVPATPNGFNKNGSNI